MVPYFKELTHWKQRNAYNIIIEDGNGSTTSKLKGLHRMIDKACHWSASENENKHKENVMLTLKEQTKQNKQTNKNIMTTTIKIPRSPDHLILMGRNGYMIYLTYSASFLFGKSWQIHQSCWLVLNSAIAIRVTNRTYQWPNYHKICQLFQFRSSNLRAFVRVNHGRSV